MRIRNTALYQHFSYVNPDPHGLLEPQQGAVPRAAQKYAGPREAQNAPALEPPKMHRPRRSPKCTGPRAAQNAQAPDKPKNALGCIYLSSHYLYPSPQYLVHCTRYSRCTHQEKKVPTRPTGI